MEKWEGWGRKKVGEVIASTVWWVVFFCVWLLKIFYLFLLLYLGFSITDQAPQREIMLQKAVSALRMEVGWVKNTDGVKTTIPSSLEVVSFFHRTVSRGMGGFTLICSSGGRNCMSCLRTVTSEQIKGYSRSSVWSGWMCLPTGEQEHSRPLGVLWRVLSHHWGYVS